MYQWYITISRNIFFERLDCHVQGQGPSKGSEFQFRFVWTVMFWTVKPFATKLCMVYIIMSQTVMQKDDFAVFQGQGHSDGSLIICIFPVMSSNPFGFCNETSVDHTSLIGWNVLLEVWTVVFSVKFSAKLQNLTECLSIPHFLDLWFLQPNYVCWQTRYKQSGHIHIYGQQHYDLQCLGKQLGGRVFYRIGWQTLFVSWFGLEVRRQAGKQRDLGSNLLRLAFRSCGLWTLSCDFVPHN